MVRDGILNVIDADCLKGDCNAVATAERRVELLLGLGGDGLQFLDPLLGKAMLAVGGGNALGSLVVEHRLNCGLIELERHLCM